jgi:hypothetical protein
MDPQQAREIDEVRADEGERQERDRTANHARCTRVSNALVVAIARGSAVACRLDPMSP